MPPKSNRISFDGINKFNLYIKSTNLEKKSRKEEIKNHIHNECEICITISGNVSFMVEDKIYPISPGDAIITRPFENHHCIYHSDAPHKLFWILFSADGNEDILDLFFNREAGENNKISFSISDSERLTTICNKLLCASSQAEQYLNFFTLISILNFGTVKGHTNAKISPETISALEIINNNITEPITISDLADTLHISINTLERHFKNEVGLTPRQYIYQKRMTMAVSLLKQNYSVYDTCEKSGFSDYSHFIAMFKHHFGLTPMQYRKKHFSN